MSYDVMPSFDPMAKQARIFTASIGLMPVGGTTTAYARARLLIANPANSGRLIHMMGLSLGNGTSAPVTVLVHHNPTTGIPTAPAPVAAKNTYLKAPGDATNVAPKSVVTGDTAVGLSLLTIPLANAALPVMGGSTGQLPPLVAPANNRPVSNLTPILLDPGASLGYDITTGNASGPVAFAIYFWEEG